MLTQLQKLKDLILMPPSLQSLEILSDDVKWYHLWYPNPESLFCVCMCVCARVCVRVRANVQVSANFKIIEFVSLHGILIHSLSPTCTSSLWEGEQSIKGKPGEAMPSVA